MGNRSYNRERRRGQHSVAICFCHFIYLSIYLSIAIYSNINGWLRICINQCCYSANYLTEFLNSQIT